MGGTCQEDAVPEIQWEAGNVSGAGEKSEQAQEDAGGWLTLGGTAV